MRRTGTTGFRAGSSRNEQKRRLHFESLEQRLPLASDFGDAPALYPTLLAYEGAWHEAIGPMLGSSRAAEADGLTAPTANGDDIDGASDQDGVQFGSIRVGRVGAYARVSIQNAPAGAKLDAWIDFDGDGTWNGAGEQIANSIDVVDGTKVIRFNVPANIPDGNKIARFRLSTQGGLSPTGPAVDGEVEDYSVLIRQPLRASAEFRSIEQLVTTDFGELKVIDLDRDRDLDLLSVSNRNGTITWHENNGSQSFMSHTIVTNDGINGVRSVAIADMDGDGDLDIVSAATGDYAIAWHENDGRQNFATHVLLAAGLEGQMVQISDVDGDADLDIIVTLNGRLSWLGNDGEGSFTEHVISAEIFEMNGLNVVDLDQDGDQDVVALGVRSILFFENTGISFNRHSLLNTAYVMSDLVVADFDGDGDIDLASVAPERKTLSWHTNYGSGKFSGRTVGPLGSVGTSIGRLQTGDLDGDGRLDILVGGYWARNLTEKFAMPRARTGTRAPVVADLDKDGDLDIIGHTGTNSTIGFYENVQYTLSFYEKSLDPKEGRDIDFELSLRHYQSTKSAVDVKLKIAGTAIYDVDYRLDGVTYLGDGLAVVTIPASEYLIKLRGTIINDNLYEIDESIVISIVDDNRFGIHHPTEDGTVTYTLSDDEAGDFGDAPHPFPIARHGAAGPQLGSTRDIESNSKSNDMASGDDDPADPTGGIVFGTFRPGQQNASLVVNVQNAPSGARLDAWVDFNGDGNWGGANEKILSSVAVVDGANLLAFDVPSYARPGTTYSRIRLSTSGGLGPSGESIDGEVEDVLVQIMPPAAASGHFSAAHGIVPNVRDTIWDFDSGDIDGDGDIDVVVASNRGVLWYENSGGQFVIHPIKVVEPRDNAYTVVIGDLDGDGDLDVVSTGFNSNLDWHQNDGQGAFVSHAIGKVGHNTNSTDAVSLADLDDDGDIDILVPGAPFAWYVNLGHGLFEHRDAGNYAKVNSKSRQAVDLDRDGNLDVVALGEPHRSWLSEPAKNYWFENVGYQFTEREIVSENIRGHYLADLNHDGYQDIVGVSEDDKLMWLRNRGNGRFTAHLTTFQIDEETLTVADIDGDGFLDMLAMRTSEVSSDRGYLWFKNNGSGKFKSHFIPAEYSTYSSLHHVQAADMDNDGDLDFIASANFLDSNSDIAWFENLSSSVSVTVTPRNVSEHTGRPVTFVFHRDGVLSYELKVQFQVSGTAKLGADYVQSGANEFSGSSGSVIFPAGVDTVEFIVMPLADKLLESNKRLVVTLVEGEEYIPRGNVTAIAVIRDSQGGDFGDAPDSYSTTRVDDGARHAPTGPTLGSRRDGESDGKSSKHATGDGTDEDGVVVAPFQPGQFGAQAVVTIAGAPAGAYLDAWIDFDQDGTWSGSTEVIAHNLLVRNGKNTIAFDVPSFAAVGTTFARFRLSTSGGLSPRGAAQDGEVEDYEVVIEPPAPSSGTFAPKKKIAAGVSDVTHIATADFDGDGDADLLALSPTNGRRLTWYENNGRGVFESHVLEATVSVTRQWIVDIDSDGDFDILALLPDQDVAKYLNDGNGNFVRSDFSTSITVAALTALDFDSDGDTDLLIAGKPDNNSGHIAWLENRGAKGFTEHVILNSRWTIRDIEFADLDGDGDFDIVAANSSGDYGVEWYENDGLGRFRTHLLSGVSGPSDILVADADGDGDQDVFVQKSNAGLLYVNDGAGEFRLVLNKISSNSSFAIADFDGDGDADLLSTRYDSGDKDRVSLNLNNSNGSYVRSDIDIHKSIGTQLAVADFDGDGALDFAVSGGFYWYRNLAEAVPEQSSLFAAEALGRDILSEDNSLPQTHSLGVKTISTARVIASSKPSSAAEDTSSVKSPVKPDAEKGPSFFIGERENEQALDLSFERLQTVDWTVGRFFSKGF